MFEKLNRSLTDVIARFAPWLSPLPTAYLTARAAITHLSWPVALGAVAGIIVESLGLAAINTAPELYDYNRARRKTDPAAPVWIAVLLTIVYFAAVTGLTVMLDTFPTLSVGAPLMFPLLSMAGVTVLALRADHRRRLDAIQAERTERSEKRSVSPSGVAPLTIQVNDKTAMDMNGETFTEPNLNKANAVRRQSRTEAVAAALAFMQQHSHATLAEIGQAAGRSKAWAANVTSEMMASGRVRRNGEGWEIVSSGEDA